MKIKPILNFWQYQGFPEVRKAVDALRIDKIIFEYFPFPKTFELVGEFVKSHHKNYTHIIIAPSDIIITPENLSTLLEDIKKYPDNPVCGVANVGTVKNKDDLSVCREIPESVNHPHLWVNKDEIFTEKYLKVGFAGFPLQAIPMKLAKKFDWSVNYDTEYPRDEGIPIDYRFSKWCLNHDIPIIANMHNRIHHHKPYGVNPTGKRMRIIHEFEMLNTHVRSKWE
jgi:hypothetical protein